jgi:hypothetical protein
MGGRCRLLGLVLVFTSFMFAAATTKDLQMLMLCQFFAGVFAS